MRNRKLLVVSVTFIVTLALFFVAVATIISKPNLFVPLALAMNNRQVFETDNIADYGEFTGNYDNSVAQEHISSFFPEDVNQSLFETKKYHYKAINQGNYAYEAVLEVVISESQFEDYVGSVVGTDGCETFEWDDTFVCKTLAKDYQISAWSNDFSTFIVDKAEVSLILFSREESKVIFVAIGVSSENGITTTDLNYFFEKFGVEDRIFATRVGSYTRKIEERKTEDGSVVSSLEKE